MLTLKSLVVVLAFTTLAGAANIWQQVPTPSGASNIRDFAVNPSNNHWFWCDRDNGWFISTNQGASWQSITNSGLPTGSNGACWSIRYDPVHSQLLTGTNGNGSTGPTTWWKSSNEGSGWSKINVTDPQLTCCESDAGNDTFIENPSGSMIIMGGHWPGANSACGSFYSTDNLATVHDITITMLPSNPGGVNGCSGMWGALYNPITQDYWIGNEVEGIIRSTDGINWYQVGPFNCNSVNQMQPCIQGDGNAWGISYDSSGNPLISGQGGIYRGVNNGSGVCVSNSGNKYCWTQIRSTPDEVRTLFRDPNGALYYGFRCSGCGDPNNVYQSTDDGSSWHAWNSGLSQGEAWHFLYNAADRRLYTVLQGVGVFQTINPITGGGSNLQPPTNLQLSVQ